MDDDAFFRMALRTILTNTLGFSDVLEAETFDQANALLSEKHIDLAVFDLIMPGMAGPPGTLKAVRDRFPHLCVVMASNSSRREDILLALQAGVNGYIPKNIGLKEFSSALTQILEGRVYVPASIASPGIAGSADEIPIAESEVAATLTPRQKDALTLVVKANSNKEIARELGLGEGTVKVHLASLFRTLGVHSRSAAAAKGAVIVWENARSLH